MPVVERVCFQFQRRCSMSRSFCYIPVDGVRADGLLRFKIVDRCVDIGARVITFGGAIRSCILKV